MRFITQVELTSDAFEGERIGTPFLVKRASRKMAGTCWHVGFLRSARATLEVVLRYLMRQINRRITFTLYLTLSFTFCC
jgi:hypothetical protein